MSNADTNTVEQALDTLLAAHDPKVESYQEFRGHQFDAGLAWVHFPVGHGGLGVAPQLQRVVEPTPERRRRSRPGPVARSSSPWPDRRS